MKMTFYLPLMLLCSMVFATVSIAASNVALHKPVQILTNGTDDPYPGAGESPIDVTDGSLDGVVCYRNVDYNQLMEIGIIIDLQGNYDISKIRYNVGNVQRAETWNADVFISPIDSTGTNPGTTWSGAWTEHNGSGTHSEISITLQKTRTVWERDWLCIGEIEVYGEPIAPEPISLPGDFDSDGDIDGYDLSAFSKIYGKSNLEYDLINTSNAPILNQSEKIEGTNDYLYALKDKHDGDIGPGGCVPVSFAMMFIHYFNITNPYDVDIDISPTSSQTVNIVNTIGNHLDAFVENGSTWVTDTNVYERMKEYTVAFDTESTPERVFVEWDIDYYSPSTKTNNEWIQIFKQKLLNSEPILFAGYVVTPMGQGGHASLITGYKNICGVEYIKIHDTWSRTAQWWRIVKNTSLTVNGNTENGLLCFMRDNGESLFYLNGMVSIPTYMLTSPSY